MELKEQEDLGTWDPRRAARINAWAGHGSGRRVLLSVAPFCLGRRLPSCRSEVVIQPLGRLDARLTRQIPSEDELHSSEGAPHVQGGCLPPPPDEQRLWGKAATAAAPSSAAATPPTTTVANSGAAPSLTAANTDAEPVDVDVEAEESAEALPGNGPAVAEHWSAAAGAAAGAPTEENVEEDVDVSQLDSPETQRQLLAAGVRNAEEASSNVLARIFNLMPVSPAVSVPLTVPSLTAPSLAADANIGAAPSLAAPLLTAPSLAAPSPMDEPMDEYLEQMLANKAAGPSERAQMRAREYTSDELAEMRTHVAARVEVLMDNGVVMNPLLARMYGGSSNEAVESGSSPGEDIVLCPAAAAGPNTAAAASPAAATSGLTEEQLRQIAERREEAKRKLAATEEAKRKLAAAAAASSASSTVSSSAPAPAAACTAASSSAPPLVLQPAPSLKRPRAEGKAAATKRCRENPWMCICRSQWPVKGGNPGHQPACHRKRWTLDISHLPVVGTRVTCLESAGPRAGKVFVCKSVKKDGWEEVN